MSVASCIRWWALRTPPVYQRRGRCALRTTSGCSKHGALEQQRHQDRKRYCRQTGGGVQRVLSDLPPAVRVQQQASQRLAFEQRVHLPLQLRVGRVRPCCGAHLRVGLASCDGLQVATDEAVGVGPRRCAIVDLPTAVLLEVGELLGAETGAACGRARRIPISPTCSTRIRMRSPLFTIHPLYSRGG